MSNWFKFALKQEYKDVVSDSWKPRFGHIFGKKTRIVIPMHNEWLLSIKDKLEKGETKTGSKYKVANDFSVAYIQKVKRDGTPDNRAVSLGRLINSELGSHYMDEWARQVETFQKTKESEYSIVLSIDPVDVARMSDHKGVIESCHSPGGQYFNCALSEAASGGGVAYVVPSSQLKGINLDEYEKKDLFWDEDREVGNSKIKPISRIRINRYAEEDERDNEIAIPVDVSYGKYVNNFYDSVKSFLLDAQKDKINNVDLSDHIRQGGSYIDINDRKIMEDFFGHDANVKRNLVNKSDLSIMRAQWESECDNTQIRFNEKYEFASVYFDIDNSGNDDELGLSCGGEVIFSFKINPSIQLDEAIEENIIKKCEKNHFLSKVFSDKEVDLKIDNVILTIRVYGYFEAFNPDDFGYAADEFERWIGTNYSFSYQEIAEILHANGVIQDEKHISPSANIDNHLRNGVANLFGDNGSLIYQNPIQLTYAMDSIWTAKVFEAIQLAWVEAYNEGYVNPKQLQFWENDREVLKSIKHPEVRMAIGTSYSTKAPIFRKEIEDHDRLYDMKISIQVNPYYYHSLGNEYFVHMSKNWGIFIQLVKTKLDAIVSDFEAQIEKKYQDYKARNYDNYPPSKENNEANKENSENNSEEVNNSENKVVQTKTWYNFLK